MIYRITSFDKFKIEFNDFYGLSTQKNFIFNKSIYIIYDNKIRIKIEKNDLTKINTNFDVSYKIILNICITSFINKYNKFKIIKELI